MGLNLSSALSGAVGGFLTGGPAGALAGGIAGALAPDGSPATTVQQLDTQTDTSSTQNVVTNQDTTNQIDTLSSLLGSGTTTGATTQQQQGATTGETAGAGTAVVGPSELALPGIQELLAGASANLGAPATAGFTEAQTAGQNLQTGTAAGQIGELGQQTAATQAFLSNPDLLTPGSNPALAASIQGSINPLLRSLMESILPSIAGQATAVGGIGGSRQGVAEAGAIGNFLDTAGNISAQQASQAYQSGLNTLLQSQTNANPLAALLQEPGNLLQQVGGTQQTQAQVELDEQNKKLLEFANLIGSQNLGTQGATTETGTTAGTTTASGSGTQTGATTNQQIGTGSSTQVGNVSGTTDTSKTGTSATTAIQTGETTPGTLESGPLGDFGAGLAIGDFLNGTPPGTSTPTNSPFPTAPDGSRIAVGGQQQ